ncbi:MAG TPA: amidohydrolase [Gaiellaceae bacterium]
MVAEVAFVDGTVVTAEPAAWRSDALAVAAGRVVAVGAEDVRAVVGPATEVVDLGGRTLLPGINDSHAHVGAFGATRPPLAVDVGYPSVRSIADVRGRVHEAAARRPAGEWILGTGWDLGYLEECVADARRQPGRADLDAVSPDHPVLLRDFSGHAIWVNSRALELAGVTRETPSPDGGEVVRDAATGEPTGLLRELAASALVQSHAPSPTREQKRQALLAAVDELHRLGVTSVTEPTLGPGSGGPFAMSDVECLELYAELAEEGALRMRVNALLLFGEGPTEVERGLREFVPPADVPGWLRIGGVKVFADGIPPLKTAWMHQEYVGGGFGSLVVPGADDEARSRELAEMIRVAHGAGYQVGVHVIGDAAIDATVDAFAAAVAAHPRPDPRHYLIHSDFARPATLARMASLGIGMNAQPQIKTTISDLMDRMLGEERSAYQWPLRTALDAGVALSCSSDMPVVYPDWRVGVANAVLRESKATGRVSGPEQRITVEEALTAYTRTPARQDFAEDRKGTLAVGMAADCCVVDGDLLGADPREIPELPVVLTMVDGRVVFG